MVQNGPAQLVYSVDDTAGCKAFVTSYWDEVEFLREKYLEDQRQIDESLQKILDLQEWFQVELVDNQQFLEWLTSDWETSW